MNKVYLVTGGNGFVGNNVVKQLLDKGERVRVLIRDSALAKDAFKDYLNDPKMSDRLELILGDVRKYEAVSSLFRENEECVFIHAAAIVDITGYQFNFQMHDVNVNGTKNVLRVCKEKKVKRFVYVSSVHAITEPKKRALTTEPTVFNPKTVVGAYAKTKAESTAEVKKAIAEGLDAVIVHPSGIIGPNDYGNTHLTQTVIDYYEGKIPAAVKGGYDFVDVRDVALGVVAAAENGRVGENYILSNRYVTVKELLDLLYENLGTKEPKLSIPMWLARFSLPFLKAYFTLKNERPLYTSYSLYTLRSNSNFSHEKASAELNYSPRDFSETVRDTCEFLKARGKIGEKKS